MTSVAADRPLPAPDAHTAPYWEAAHGHRFVLPHCEECGRYHFYPRSLCPFCRSARLIWSAASGRGTVYSFSVIHRAPSPAFAGDVPYVVATVALEEGPHLMTNIVGCKTDEVRIGMAVVVDFLDIGDETLPVFQPAEGGGGS